MGLYLKLAQFIIESGENFFNNYKFGLQKINKTLFLNKKNITISPQGLLKFHFIMNLLSAVSSIKLFGEKIPDTKEESDEFQLIMSGLALAFLEKNKGYKFSKEEAKKIWEEDNLVINVPKSLGKHTSDNKDINKLVTSSFFPSIKDISKKEQKDITTFYLPETDKLIANFLGEKN
jgi:hypothetical protein